MLIQSTPSHSSSTHWHSSTCEPHPMNQPQRDKERRDHKILSETGDKISKEETQAQPTIKQAQEY